MDREKLERLSKCFIEAPTKALKVPNLSSHYSFFKITNEVMADSSHIPPNFRITYICSFCTEKKTNVIGK